MVAEPPPSEDSIMARTARLLLTVGLLGGMLASPAARAQAPAQPPAAAIPAPATRPDIAQLLDDPQGLPAPLPDRAAPAPEGAWEPEFLKSMPRPPDQPRSLFQPAPAPGPPPPDFERYFELDPLLDPSQWGKLGWFADVQIQAIHPSLFFGQFRHSVVTPLGQRVIVAPGAAKQDWTVAPRLEIGYRLPSGFGGFSFSDRWFTTSGTGPFIGPAGSTTRTTHFGVNYSDWDYFSREYTPWANWGMAWRFGVRLAETWTNTHVDLPSARASGGVFEEQASNYTVGAGPHFGLMLDRKFADSGFSFIAKLDIANTFTRQRSLFSATSLTPGGAPARGAFTQNYWQQVPILNYQIGLGWQPPRNPNISVYMGYLYEFWWQVGTNSNLTPFNGGTRAAFDNQGIVFQAQVRF
jgi:hypothetical protein